MVSLLYLMQQDFYIKKNCQMVLLKGLPMVLILKVIWTTFNTLKAVRNILVHEYFGISYDIIWTSIQKDIPPLKEKIESLIATKFSDSIQ